MKDKECIFCKIAAGDIETPLVYEDPRVVAFKDLNPQAPIHILIIPREHFSSVREMSDPKLSGRLLDAARAIAREQNLEDFRLVINTGSRAGQSVFHVHLHLLAGRKMNWPPG
jgi:histidine triad (HIT) family protein